MCQLYLILIKISHIQILIKITHIIIIILVLIAGILVLTMVSTEWKSAPGEIPFTTAYSLGKVLLTDFVLIFELLGILLLIALIGAASIARREKE